MLIPVHLFKELIATVQRILNLLELLNELVGTPWLLLILSALYYLIYLDWISIIIKRELFYSLILES